MRKPVTDRVYEDLATRRSEACVSSDMRVEKRSTSFRLVRFQWISGATGLAPYGQLA